MIDLPLSDGATVPKHAGQGVSVRWTHQHPHRRGTGCEILFVPIHGRLELDQDARARDWSRPRLLGWQNSENKTPYENQIYFKIGFVKKTYEKHISPLTNFYYPLCVIEKFLKCVQMTHESEMDFMRDNFERKSLFRFGCLKDLQMAISPF